MSTSGPRYHIPFPRAFLSLNTPIYKATTSGNVAASPDSEVAAHSFLSNRPAVPRHSSISSVSSSDSTGSAPYSPPTQAVDAPVGQQKVAAFLALNSKYTAPPATVKEMSGEKSGFLSNRR